MQRILLLCLSLIYAFSSFAISKKTRLLLSQRDSLAAKIQKEYMWTTNFDSIKNNEIKQLYIDFDKRMEEVKKYSSARYSTDEADPPKYVKIFNEEKVESFRSEHIYYPSFRHNYDSQKLWMIEERNIRAKYPEIEELDLLLIKKKCLSVLSILWSKWNANFKISRPEGLLSQYNEKEKEELRKHYKKLYEDRQAYIEKRISENLKKYMEYYRSVSAQYNSRWYEGAWLGARNGHVEADYIIRITSSQLRILYHDRVVYSGSYSVKGGRIIFGNGGTIILDDSSNTIKYDGLSFIRNG